MLPVLFHIGPWPVYTYGVMVSMGFIIGYYLLLYWSQLEGVAEKYIVDLFLILVLASMIGARITFVLTYPRYFIDDYWEVFRVWNGGLTILGGAFLAFVLFLLYCWRHRLNTLLILDLFSPCIALGLVVGRLGCLGYGCCYGKPSGLPWALVFPNTDPLNPPVPRHPTQLYTSICMLFIFLILRWFRKKAHRDGSVTVLFVLLYTIYRVFIETLRADVAQESYLFGMTLAQSSSLIASFFALLFYFLYLRRQALSRGEGIELGEEEKVPQGQS